MLTSPDEARTSTGERRRRRLALALFVLASPLLAAIALASQAPPVCARRTSTGRRSS